MRTALAVLLLVPSVALAQEEDPVAESFVQAKALYGVEDPRLRCRPGPTGEIVVCADRGEDLRVPGSMEGDPNALTTRRALDGNIPTAPDLVPKYHGISAMKGCFIGGCPIEYYYVDFSALPEAPPGSDADRIAKGEIPAP